MAGSLSATGLLIGAAAVLVVLLTLGLAMLFNSIGTVATSAPGPLHLDWSGEPFAAIAARPVVCIPALQHRPRSSSTSSRSARHSPPGRTEVP